MPTLSERGRDALVRRQQAAAGVPVTITRGAETITVTAVAGETAYTSEANGGARNEISSRDYLVAVADYVFGGRPVPPKVGDRFGETVNGAVLVTECQTPENGEKEWRYSSQWRVWYRVHCNTVRGS